MKKVNKLTLIIWLTTLLFSSTAQAQQHEHRCVLISLALCNAVHDKPVMILAAVHTGLVITDGVQSSRFASNGWHEGNPISRVIIGREPTWKRMIPAGVAFIVAETWLAETMRRSKNRTVRKLALLPQAVSISVTIEQVGHNAGVLP